MVLEAISGLMRCGGNYRVPLLPYSIMPGSSCLEDLTEIDPDFTSCAFWQRHVSMR